MTKKKICAWCKEEIKIQPGKKSKRFYRVERKGKTYYFCKSNHEQKYQRKYFHRHDTYERTFSSKKEQDRFANIKKTLDDMRKDNAKKRKKREKREREIYLSLTWWQKFLINIRLKRLWDYETRK